MQDKKLLHLEIQHGSFVRTRRKTGPLCQVTASCRFLQAKVKVVPQAKKSVVTLCGSLALLCTKARKVLSRDLWIRSLATIK